MPTLTGNLLSQFLRQTSDSGLESVTTVDELVSRLVEAIAYDDELRPMVLTEPSVLDGIESTDPADLTGNDLLVSVHMRVTERFVGQALDGMRD